MGETCHITGTIFDAARQPVPGAYLMIVKLLKDHVAVSTRRVTVRADASGNVSFDVLRDSTAYIEAAVVGFNVPGGIPVSVPDADSADFEDLIPARNPPSTAVSQAVFNSLIASLSGERVVTESDTLAADDAATIIADSVTDISLALPPAAQRVLPYYVKNINGGLVTITPDGVETINRGATLEIAEGDGYSIRPVQSGWETF